MIKTIDEAEIILKECLLLKQDVEEKQHNFEKTNYYGMRNVEQVDRENLMKAKERLLNLKMKYKRLTQAIYKQL